MSKLTPFDVAKAINSKTGVLEVDKSLSKFVLNKIYSNSKDTVMFANEANMFTGNITEQMLFDFYYYGVPKKSRYDKWFKQPKDENPDLIEYVQNYFNCSKKQAIENIESFSDEVIQSILEDIDLLKNPYSTKKKKGKK